MRSPHRLLASLPLFAALGCGTDFAPPSEVAGVRVLAVRQDPASGSPGVTVNLSMLLADSRSIGHAEGAPPPELSVTWFGGCHNPPGRQYFACLPALRELAQKLDDGSASADELAGKFGRGLEFAAPIPDDILTMAPLLEHDPIHYGVSYVFFVACAGTPRFDSSIQDGIPVTCTAMDGKRVGASGLVVGFTTIYTYEGVDNQNPVMTELDFDGETMPASTALEPATPCTSDDDCAGEYRHRRTCTPDTRTCAPVLGACSGEDCPALRVTPRIDTASVERFTDGYEVMWASYYASSGAMSEPTRLVVDRMSGLTSDPSTTWKMPGAAATSRIWVTLNDQRGGATWAFFDVAVE